MSSALQCVAFNGWLRWGHSAACWAHRCPLGVFSVILIFERTVQMIEQKKLLWNLIMKLQKGLCVWYEAQQTPASGSSSKDCWTGWCWEIIRCSACTRSAWGLLSWSQALSKLSEQSLNGMQHCRGNFTSKIILCILYSVFLFWVRLPHLQLDITGQIPWGLSMQWEMDRGSWRWWGIQGSPGWAGLIC